MTSSKVGASGLLSLIKYREFEMLFHQFVDAVLQAAGRELLKIDSPLF
jgi:hypothetical protein